MDRPKFLLAFLPLVASLAHASNPASPLFPVVGVGPGQWLRLHAIALGTNQQRCQAVLSFRDTMNATIGPSLEVDLTIGKSAFLDFPAGDARTEISPVIEHRSNPSSCFSAVELMDAAGTYSYVSSSMAPAIRSLDNPYPSFVDAGPGESLRVVTRRRESGVCRIRLRLRDDRGRELAAEQGVEPVPGQTALTDLDTSGHQTRIVIDLKPAEFHSAAGCMISAELIDVSTGRTTRHVPLSIADSSEPAPPSPPARTRNGVIQTAPSTSMPIGTPLVIQAPLGLPPVPFPADNPPTRETIVLGRRLYYDTNLSRDRTESCASCHDPAAGFRDPRRVSQGVNGMQGVRQSMSIFNVAYVQQPFWDGRAASLEDQALGPVQNPLEFAFSYHGIERRLSADPSYVDQFDAAFGPGPITYEKVAKCLATFQRTILSGNSPFDRFFYGGDKTALTVEAQRGFVLFTGREQCNQCHNLDGTGDLFANTGIAATSFNQLSDQGRWKVTGNEGDRGAFRTVSLRNVALHAPYMHDGSLRTLEDVLAYYFRGGNRNRWISGLMPPAPPPASVSQDTSDLIAFLRSLTGDMPQNVGPLE